jgi:hypothetical protein
MDSLSFLEKTLRSDTSWYTGIQIKQYIKEQILVLATSLNTKIATGQWSAYAHFTVIPALHTHLSKLSNVEGELYIDPLLPQGIIDSLYNYSLNYLEIDRYTLAPIAINTITAPILIYLQTGNTTAYTQLFQVAKQNKTPIICIVDTGVITHNIVQILQDIQQGAVLFITNNNCITHYLEQQVQLISDPLPLVVSYFLEPRITASLEYSLGDSKIHYHKFLESLHSAISSRDFSPINWGKQQYTKFLFGIGKTIEPKKTSANLIEAWGNLLQEAIPDTLFVLAQEYWTKQQLHTTNESILTQGYSQLHEFFIEQVSHSPQGTLMIPPVSTQEILTRFLFFSTDRQKWLTQLSNQDKHAYKLTSKSTTKHAQFCSKYGIVIDLF